ncbi:MAG: hypothetical protein ACOX5K_00805 [Bacteroidales bacterium]|jgi:hypothetical protein
MKKFKAIFIVKILTVSMAFLFTSCYSSYLSIGYQAYPGAVWNNEHTKVAFVASKTAYRSAKGIARFPDGGIPLYLLNDVGLYLFDYENKILDELTAFNELADLLGPYSSKWDVKLALTDTMVYYLLSPVPNWDRQIGQAQTPDNLGHITSLKEKYGQPRAFHMDTKTDTTVDPTAFNNLLIEPKECDPTSLNKQLAKVPLLDWNLRPQEIYPKSDRKYIEETIYLRNGSSETRRAVVEQIIAKLSKAEIELLLEKMDDYKNSLEGLKKTEYEFYSKDTYEQIKILL